MSTTMPAVAAAVPTSERPAGPTLAERYRAVRRQTESLCPPLEVEDYVVRTMPDASPAKWHLAHTSWFFETFVLRAFAPAYAPLDDRYAYLFNSCYGRCWHAPRTRRWTTRARASCTPWSRSACITSSSIRSWSSRT